MSDNTHADRPVDREECRDGHRPCPYVSCKYHLYLHVTDAGTLKINFPTDQPEDLKTSCALDVADEGGVTLEEVGAKMNITRERARQIEARALEKLFGDGRTRRALKEFTEED